MLILNRLASDIHSTRGVLVYARNPVCYTLELPWLGNVPNKSCIPCGEYPLVKTSSARHPESFLVKHVPFRSGILIHAGNFISQTQGCVLVGLDFHDNRLYDSRAALARLNSLLGSTSTLIIREAL